MKTLKTILLLASVVVLTVPALAVQDEGNITLVYHIRPKAGMTQQFEAAFKGHLDWLRQNNENWAWRTYNVITGDRMGEYIVRSSGHNWSDFDARAEFSPRARDRWLANVAQYVDTMSSTIVTTRSDLRRWPEGMDAPPMVSVYTFHLNYGSGQEFSHTINKIHEGIEKSNYPINYQWNDLVSGGEAGTVMLVMPRKSWSELKSPEKPLWQALEEVHGRAGADAIRASLTKTVHCQKSFMATFRQDLSYQPAGR